MRSELMVLWAWVQTNAHHTSRRAVRNERGATMLEYILMAGGLAGIALLVIVILRNTILSKANSIPTD